MVSFVVFHFQLVVQSQDVEMVSFVVVYFIYYLVVQSQSIEMVSFVVLLCFTFS